MSVTYKEYFKDNVKTHSNTACFSNMWGYSWRTKDLNKPIKIEYSSPISNIHNGDITIFSRPANKLSKECVEFYVKFLKGILDKKIFTAEIIYSADEKESNNKVNWVLECETLNRQQALLYLTAFRYFAEFPGTVEKLYNESLKTPKPIRELFKDFQNIHLAEKNCHGGHSLVYFYGWGAKDFKFEPISLKDFRTNLKDKSIKDVNSHFIVPIKSEKI